MPRKPVWKRPLDLLWFAYLVLHIPPTVLLDSQTFLPARFIPGSLLKASHHWIQISNDPLLRHVRDAHHAWFRAFIAMELVIQLPIFVLGAIGLWQGLCIHISGSWMSR